MPDNPSGATLHAGTYFQGKYEILEHIGNGGFGAVYKARHLELGLTVAIKVLHPSMLTNDENRTRFQTEGKILSELSHPNVVHFYENGISDQRLPYIVMEFLQGETLSSILSKKEKLSPEEAIKIGIQVCDALSAAHSSGIVHRDLKPNNIVLLTRRDSTVKLVDFGLSRVMESSNLSNNQHLTKTGFLIGSVRYMSPEHCKGGKADDRSDIYALGCILYECISGELPLSADNPVGMLHKHANEQPPLLSEASPGVHIPAGLDIVIANALVKDPDGRYQTAADMKRDLELVQRSKGGKLRALADRKQYKLTRPAAINLGMIAVMLVAIVVLLVPQFKSAVESLFRSSSVQADNR